MWSDSQILASEFFWLHCFSCRCSILSGKIWSKQIGLLLLLKEGRLKINSDQWQCSVPCCVLLRASASAFLNWTLGTSVCVVGVDILEEACSRKGHL